MHRIHSLILKSAVLSLCCTFSTAEVYAQSFVEKLEQKVREQLLGNSQESEEKADELPQPKSGNVPQAGGNPVNPSPKLPPPQSSTNSDTANNQVPVQTGSSPIYLGLEAEGVVGGGIGVRVAAVTPQSPAWKAGFKVDDKILAINGFAIANMNSMVEQLLKNSPGETVRFLVARGGRNVELKAVLMDAQLAGQMNLDSPPPSGPPWLGVKVNDLTSGFSRAVWDHCVSGGSCQLS